MLDELFEGRTFDSIINDDTFTLIQLNLWLKTNHSGKLTDEQIDKIVDRFGYTPNLIMFHINTYRNLNDSNKSLLFEYVEPENYKYFNLSNLRCFYKYYYTNFVELTCHYEAKDREENLEKLKAFFEALIMVASDYGANFIYEILDEIIKLKSKIGLKMPNAIDLYQKANVPNKIKFMILSYGYFSQDEAYTTGFDNFGNYIIAFKGVEEDNTSIFSDRIKYVKSAENEPIVSVCDISPDDNSPTSDNSFGISAGLESLAKTYGKKVIRLKIYINDIKYISMTDGRLRASRVYVLD